MFYQVEGLPSSPILPTCKPRRLIIMIILMMIMMIILILEDYFNNYHEQSNILRDKN